MESRISWIDALKGIGIIFVILGHIYGINNNVNIWIYSFHMPLFFFISGYLFLNSKKNISNIEYIKKKAKALLIPFILFEMILFIYWICIEKRFRNYPVFDMGPSWFLVVLFFVSIIAYLIRGCLKNKKILLGIILLSIISIILIKKIFINIDKTQFIWILRILIGMSWFLIGLEFKLMLDHFTIKCKNKNIKTGITVAFIIILLGLSVFTSLKNGMVSVFSGIMNNYALYYISGIFGIFLFLILSKEILFKSKILSWLGKYSIIILATHEPIKRIIIGICEKLGITYEFFKTSYIPAFFILLVILVIEFIIVYVIKYIKKKCDKNKIIKELLYFIK